MWVDKAEHRIRVQLSAEPNFRALRRGARGSPAASKQERGVEALAAQASFDPDVVGRKEACERLGEKLGSAGGSAAGEVPLARAPRSTPSRKRSAGAITARCARPPRRRSRPTKRRAPARRSSRRSRTARRWSAAPPPESLGTAGADPDTAAALERTLTTDLAYGARAAAVRSLASIAAPRAWDAALEAAKQPSERDAVRSAALEALRKIDAPARSRSSSTPRAWANPTNRASGRSDCWYRARPSATRR